MANWKWTAEENAFLEAHPTDYAAFCDRFGDGRRTRTGWHQKRKELGLLEAAPPPPSATAPRRTVEHVAADPLPDPEIDELGDALLELVRARNGVGDLTAPADRVRFRAADGLPFALAFTGDWHLGAGGVDVDRLIADLGRLAGEPGVWLVGMGDYVEGVNIHVKAVSSLYGGAVNDGDGQEALFRRMARLGGDRWLALVAGNHDEWLARHGGLSRVARLARDLGVTPFPQGGGTLDVGFEGGAAWNVAVAHTHRGRSQINTTNEHRRMYDAHNDVWGEHSWEGMSRPALLVTAHLHYPEHHVTPRNGRLVHYLRSGTYKLRDGYARDGGFTPMAGVPVAVFRPDREPLVFVDHHDALPVLAALRAAA